MKLISDNTKKHFCPNCRKYFDRYVTLRSTERLGWTEYFYLYWVDRCPFCDYIFNKGRLTFSGKKKFKEIKGMIKASRKEKKKKFL